MRRKSREVEIRDSKLQPHEQRLVAGRSVSGYPEAAKAARYLERRWGTRPRVGITLGSGLGDVARQVRGAKIPYESIPYFPLPSVTGHGGTLHLGRWGKVPVAVLAGRLHLYEGYNASQVIFPTRVLALLGVKVLLLTCAVGGIAARAAPGSFMIFSDHLNLQGASPLAGLHDAHWGARFVDMSQAYDHELRREAHKAAACLGLKCLEGVYAGVFGPNYETPAEIQALKRLGADGVGMSTVPEVVAARQLGLRVLALAVVTNRAAGLTRRSLSHREVLEVGQSAVKHLAAFLDVLLPRV